MSIRHKIMHEVKAVVLTTLYFAVCFGLLIALKRIMLAEYAIEFHGLSIALLGALVAAKVVLVLEHVSLGQWIRRHAAALDVVLRTALYTIGVLIALLLEKAFEARHEYGGFGTALVHIFQHREVHHVWANTMAVGLALLLFNAVSVVRRRIGSRELIQSFLAAPVDQTGSERSEVPAGDAAGSLEKGLTARR